MQEFKCVIIAHIDLGVNYYYDCRRLGRDPTYVSLISLPLA